MEYLERRRALVESRLSAVLDAAEPEAMTERVEHVSLSGGKRVRPMVTLLAFEAAGGELVGEDGRGSEASAEAVDFAVGIELVHNASLVVDDIIDESDLRRGVESAWAAFGYGPAMATSDGLLGEAFSLFGSDDRAMRTVAEAMVELGEGEAIELVAAPTTETEYMELARRKTGALFRAAAELGAIAANADTYTTESFGGYAERVQSCLQAGCDMAIIGNALDEVDPLLDLDRSKATDSALRLARLHGEAVATRTDLASATEWQQAAALANSLCDGATNEANR